MADGTYLASEEPYVVYNVKEIAQILSDLVKQKTMLKASFNGGNDVYLTTVIAVNVQRNAVYLDIGRDEAFNVRLLASDYVVFSKDDGIKIKWVSEQISEVSLQDGRAIKIALPQSMMRLQRREFFRLATPRVNPVPCLISIPDEENPSEVKDLELALTDVSLGGIGAVLQGPLDKALVIGASFDGCKISFPDVGVTSLTLQVRNITPMHTKDNVIKHRIGFQFIDPSRGNQGLIQRYTYNLERVAIALASGAIR